MTARTPGVQLLGGFGSTLGGHPLRLPLSTQRVVAFLALHPRPLQRLYVAATLWPDSPEERANASLRSALWRLGLRGFRAVVATPTQVTFAPDVDLDLDQAVLCAKRLLHGVGSADARDVALLSDAGDVLPDWYDDWLLVERERFHQLRLHALESLCEQCARERRFGQAVDAGLAAVAIEPLRESPHRLLIQSFLAEHNTADALRQYGLYRRLAEERLGIEPSPRMRELVRDLPVD
jgi:DNA-binding SARP family transcriptional activator